MMIHDVDLRPEVNFLASNWVDEVDVLPCDDVRPHPDEGRRPCHAPGQGMNASEMEPSFGKGHDLHIFALQICEFGMKHRRGPNKSTSEARQNETVHAFPGVQTG